MPEAHLPHPWWTYYSDITGMEPRLLEMYDEMLPQIERAIGE